MAGFEDRILVVISSAAGGAITEINQLGRSAEGADVSTQNLARTMKGALVAGAAAFIGTGLVSFLSDSVTAYADAAKAAADLADATGSSVEEVSRMQAALEDAGISADKSAGLLTKFTSNAGKNQKLLEDLNVTLVEGADGSIDYADGMVQAVDSIMKIGDASQRNQALVELFGKQGAAAFQDLMASGASLQEAMDAIDASRVFDSEDVQRAYAYDDAMDSLAASFQGVQYRIGEALVPVVAGAMDALSGLIDFLGEIPGPVYIAVGAFVALKVAMESALVTGVASQVGGFLATLATGMMAVATGATTASISFGALRAALVGVMTAAWPLLAIAAIVTAITQSLHAMKEAGDAATSMDRVTMSLEDQAKQLVSTDSAWRTFIEGDNIQMAMQDITGALIDQAQATLDSADATVAQKQAAQELLDTIGEGTIQQQTANLATEEGRQAQEEYAASLNATDEMQKKATESTDALKEAVAQFLTASERTPEMMQAIADAAVAANEATLNQKQATELATIAQGEYAVSIQGVIDWQKQLNGLMPDTEEALNKVQTAYTDLAGVTDDPATWGDEVAIQAGAAKEGLLELVDSLAARGWTSDQIKQYLVDMKLEPGASDQMKTDIDTVIADIEGKENEVPINLDVDPGGEAKTKLEEIVPVEGLSADVDLTTGEGWDEAQRRREEMGKPITAKITYDTVFNPGGYEAVKSRVDYLAQDRTGSVDITTAMLPDGYNALKDRKDYLAEDEDASIGVNVTFSPDGYSALKGRVDYLSQNRIAYIDVVVRGAQSARQTIDGLAGQARAAPQGRIAMPNVEFNPLNMVRVEVDGRELRSIIRDEIAGMTPTVQGVA